CCCPAYRSELFPDGTAGCAVLFSHFSFDAVPVSPGSPGNRKIMWQVRTEEGAGRPRSGVRCRSAGRYCPHSVSSRCGSGQFGKGAPGRGNDLRAAEKPCPDKPCSGGPGVCGHGTLYSGTEKAFVR